MKVKLVLKCVLKYAIRVLIFSLVAYNILFVFSKTLFNKEYVKLFNLYISTEKEHTMEPEIKKNSLIIGCKINDNDIDTGNIIGYDIDNSIKYHRLVNIKNVDGKTVYVTKGDNNYNVDIEEKNREDIKSKIVIKIPIIGWLFKIFESKITTIFIIAVIILKILYNNNIIKQSMQRRNQKLKS